MKKRTFIAVTCLVLLTVILGACAPARATESSSQDLYNKGGAPAEMPAAAPAQPAATMAPAALEGQRAAAYDAAGNLLPEQKRLVIQNADLTIVVEKPTDALSAVAKMADDMGGFVVSSNIYKSRGEDGAEYPQGQIVVRVPAEKLDDALAQIKGLVKDPQEDVRAENRSGQDVTKDYTDAQSRLRNLEDTEKQLREIQASATRTEDIMNVFNQLTYVREQIEVLKGQIKYYEESAALSAINVQILAQSAVQPLTIGKWEPVGVARDAIQALINALKFLANLVIWLVLYLLPIALLVGIPLWLIIRALRRARRKPAPVPVSVVEKKE